MILFCEDIRDELGNKTSLMGTLGTALIVPRLPSRAKSLSVAAMIRVRGANSVRTEFSITVEGGPDGLKTPSPEVEDIERDDDAPTDEWNIQLGAFLNGMPLVEGMKIRAECKVNDEHKFSGTLLVFASNTSEKDGASPQPETLSN